MSPFFETVPIMTYYTFCYLQYLRVVVSHVNLTVKPTEELVSRFFIGISQFITSLLVMVQMFDVTHVSCRAADSILAVMLFLTSAVDDVSHLSMS